MIGQAWESVWQTGIVAGALTLFAGILAGGDALWGRDITAAYRKQQARRSLTAYALALPMVALWPLVILGWVVWLLARLVRIAR